MLAFFPRCHEEELLFSICARYHEMAGNANLKQTLLELLGSSSFCAIPDLPNHLGQLCSKIPGGGLSPDVLIQKHTLLPYYAPFLPRESVVKAQQAMIDDSRQSIHVIIGTRNSKVKSPSWFRFCEKCRRQQEQDYGYAWWQRVQQLPGVMMCPYHQSVLLNSAMRYSRENNNRRFDCLLPEVPGEPVLTNMPSGYINHLTFVATQSLWLLQHPNVYKEAHSIRGVYLNKLKERGYLTLSGRVRHQSLIRDFTSFFGEDFLIALQSDPAEASVSWLHRVLRSPDASCHPLRHILLLRFFGTEFDAFFTDNADSLSTFGNGLWPCLNKAASHFHQYVVEDCTLSRNKNKGTLVGTFVCECGYVYTRSEDSINPFQGRVKCVGNQWLTRLEELRADGLTYRALATELGVSTTVVMKQLKHSNSGHVENETNDSFSSEVTRYRKGWQNHLKANPNCTRTELRGKSAALYTWLWRHDRSWLMHSLPDEKAWKRSSERVNWDQRDEDLCKGVAEAALEIRRMKPAIRVTLVSLSKVLNMRWSLRRQLNRLPKTHEAIQRVIESQAEFRQRS